MCGISGYTAIATWARSQKALTKSLGFKDGKTPLRGNDTQSIEKNRC